MPSTYRRSEAYVWYLNEGGGYQRRPHLPGFESNDQGQVVVVTGEVYCRFSEDGGITMCHDKHKWSSVAGLKRHIQDAHKQECAPQSRIGGLSSLGDQLAGRFFANMMRQATDAGDAELNMPPIEHSTQSIATTGGTNNGRSGDA